MRYAAKEIEAKADEVVRLARKVDCIDMMFRYNVPEEMREEKEALYEKLVETRREFIKMVL